MEDFDFSNLDYDDSANTVNFIPPPICEDYLVSYAPVNAIIGPLGSAKSSTNIMKILYHATRMRKSFVDGMRHSRWTVVRNTADQLNDTTIKSFLHWFPDGTIGYWRSNVRTYYISFGDVKAEVLFRALDKPEDAKRVLSLDTTGAFLNEAREISYDIFMPLRGRCGRYPTPENYPFGGLCADQYWCEWAESQSWYSHGQVGVEGTGDREGNSTALMGRKTRRVNGVGMLPYQHHERVVAKAWEILYGFHLKGIIEAQEWTELLEHWHKYGCIPYKRFLMDWSGMMLDSNPPEDATWLFNMPEKHEPNKKVVSTQYYYEDDSMAWVKHIRWTDGEESSTGMDTEIPRALYNIHATIEAEQQNWRFYRQPGGRSAYAENRENLAPRYYPSLMQGSTDEWISVHVDGNYGSGKSGKPVYGKSFNEQFHVSTRGLVFNPMLPLGIGLDLGRTPAAIICQLSPDGRVNILEEVIGENIGVLTFMQHQMNPILNSKYIGCRFYLAIDPAGFYPRERDEGSMEMDLKQAGYICVRPSSNVVNRRIAAVEACLNSSLGGYAQLAIDRDKCPMIIEGFKRGYRYKLKRDGSAEVTPEKNEYSHPHDALQYICMTIKGGHLGGGLNAPGQMRQVVISNMKAWQ